MAFEEKPPTTAKQEKDFNHCPACLCGNPSAVVLTTVINKNTGEEKTGATSQFCGRDNNNNTNGILQDWYSLKSYRGYCPSCWEMNTPDGKRKYTDKQVRYAWMWLMGEVSADSDNPAMATTFKRMSLTNDQKDTAIEIVNYEAKRTNLPDSLPDKYKLAEVWG